MDCLDFEPFTPEFENPYPGLPGSDITSFVYTTPLHLCRCIDAVRRGEWGDTDYILSRPYTIRFIYNDADREITVPEGMVTDLASVPWVAKFIVERVGPHLEAAIVHDFLYMAWQDMADHGVRREDRKFADRLMYAGMKTAGVGLVKRSLIFTMIRIFGGIAYARRDPLRYVRDVPGEDS